jgi:hypothetical protein
MFYHRTSCGGSRGSASLPGILQRFAWERVPFDFGLRRGAGGYGRTGIDHPRRFSALPSNFSRFFACFAGNFCSDCRSPSASQVKEIKAAAFAHTKSVAGFEDVVYISNVTREIPGLRMLWALNRS